MRDGLGSGLDPVPARPLGLVHGRVGGREELGRRLRGRRGGHPEAGGDRDRRAVHCDHHPARESDPDPLGDLGSSLEVGPGEDEQELLPSPTAGEVDTAGRWGGEEFLIVLPGTDGAGAVRLAQRIRDYLEGRTLLTPEGVPVRITASFGVAEHERGIELDDFVAAADSALYEAKRSGKNRVQQAPAALNRP